MSSTIGLKNLGNTCYLNVALQSLLSLTHFKVILESFREPKPEVILFLLSCLVTSPYSIRSPESVYELYLALHHNTRHMPEDAVECLLRLIQYFEDNLQIQKQKINQHYQGCSCTTFWFENYSSIVHDVFIGIAYIKMTCTSCSFKTQRFETFQILPLYVESCSCIYDGFAQLLQNHEINGATCDHCKHTNTTIITNQLFHKLPPVLIFEIIGTNSLFSLDDNFITDHVHGHNRTQILYKLKSAVMYTGGHYNCLVFDSIAKEYMFIDDEHRQKTELKNHKSFRYIIYERD